MAEATLVRRNGMLFLLSWPDGFKKVKPPTQHITDDLVLARAIWLERNGHPAQAEELLDIWTSTHSVRMVEMLGIS